MTIRRANRFIRGPRRIAALTVFASMIVGPPVLAQSSDAHTDLAAGVRLLQSGQATDAKAWFDAAVKAAPRSADALTWRGICENQLQQYAPAAADFQAAIRLDKTTIPAHYNLALSLIRLHRTEAAIEQLRIVVAAQPSVVQPVYNLAVLLEASGSFAEAAQHLRRLHTIAPEDKGVTLHLLMDSLKLKETANVASLVSVLADQSTPAEIERQGGTALLESGRFADAITLLKAARSREQTAPEGDLLLARALIGNGQNAEAIALLEGAAPASEESAERTYLLALAYLGTGAVRKAVEGFEATARLDPKDARALYQLGLIAEATPQGQNEATRLLQAAHGLDPENAAYSLALARLLLVSDHAEESETVLLNMHTAGTDEAQRLALLGVALASTHKFSDAMPQLKKALDQDPKLALAQNVLGFCYMQQGQYAQAAEAYGRASELEPARALYARDAALAFTRAGQSEQAVRFAERAATLDETSAGDHVLLGKLYAAAGRSDGALQQLLRAAALNPDLDSACYLLARIYLQMGDRQQATEWSEKLTALKQKHEAEFALQKKAAATSIRSSMLLEGGSVGGDDAGVP
jgi:tetratricopeptide (TPR) repeat protein